MGDKPAWSPMVEEAPSGGAIPVDELEAQVGNQPALNDPTTEMQGGEEVHEVVPADEVKDSPVGDQPSPNPTAGLQGNDQVHEVVPADEVQDSQVGDQPSPNPTTELQGIEQVYELVPADEVQDSQVEDQPSPNPTAELQGNEQVHEVVPADEVQDSQVGDQSPPNSMQGDKEVHEVVPVDEVRDPQMAAQHASDLTSEIGEEEFWPLSGKPFFDVIIAKSHVKPLYQMVIPAKIHHTLPSCSIPTILKFRGKEWEMVYNGSGPKRLDTNWRAFVVDNNLKIGDACVFELQESSCTRLVFRVQILRGDIPAEILDKIDGETADRPMVLE